MLAYLLRRLTFAVLLVFTVSSASLILVRLAPGDFADVQLGAGASDELKAQTRARYGLDRSIAAQYGHWLLDAVRLDFGRSMMYGSPVVGPRARLRREHRGPRRHGAGDRDVRRAAAGS
jgi:peptide/nickel transport system permease protein